MKTLSANVSTGKAGDSKPAYLMTIEPGSNDSWNAINWATEDITGLVIRSNADGVSTGTTQFDSAGGLFETRGVQPGDGLLVVSDTTYTVASVDSETRLQATANINAGDPLTYTISRDFEGGRIERGGLGTIVKEVDIIDGGNVATVSDFSFTVLNQDDYLNSADFPPFLEGRTIDVRLLFTDGSGQTWPNALILHKFTIESIEYSLDVVRFECADASRARHTLQLPQNTLSDSDAAAGQGGALPDDSQGKGKPLIYGDHEYDFMRETESAGDGTDTSYNRGNILTPCRFLGMDQDGDERWLIADHQVDTIGATRAIWAFDPALNRMVEIKTVVVEQNTSAGCIISFTPNPDLYDYWLPDGSVSNEVDTDGGGNASIADKTKMCDLNNTTFGYITLINAIGANAPSYTLDIDFPTYENAGTISAVSVWSYAHFHLDGGGVRTMTINVIDATGAANDFRQYGTDAATEAGATLAVPVAATGDQNDAGAAQHIFEVHMIYKRITYKANNRLQIFAGVIGREFGAWVDADSRDQDYNENDAIAKIFGIESFLRDEMSLTSSSIDYVAYDALGDASSGDRKTFDLIFAIVEQKNSIEYISEICRSIGSISYTNYKNEESIKAIDAIPAVKQFTIADYKIVGGGDSKTSSLTVRRTSLRNVYNDIEVYYSKNLNSGEYQKLMFCNKDSKSSAVSSGYDTKCATSFTNYGFVRKFILKSDYITTDATAADLVEWLVDWFYLQKRIANFTSMIQNVDVELGDMTTPTHSRIYPSGNAIVTKIAHNLATDEISFELVDHTQDNILTNGDFETAGGGGADVFASWTEATAGTSTVNAETTAPYRGTTSCRYDLDGVASLAQITHVNVTLVVSTMYTLSFYYKGTGSAQWNIAIDNDTSGNFLQADGTWAAPAGFGITVATDWTLFVIQFTTEGAGAIHDFVFKRTVAGGANESLYIDNITLV